MIYIVDIIVNPIAVIATIVAIIVILITHRYVLFERSARQSLAWIKEEGDIYLNTHTQVLNTHILVGRIKEHVEHHNRGTPFRGSC